METILWIIIIACFIINFVGLIYPIIPAVLMIWIGVALYHFFILSEITWWTWSTLIVLTIFIFAADYAASMYFVKKYGGSKWGSRAAAVGIIAGIFVFPPFGILLVPFALVLLIELTQGNDFSQSLKIAFGTLLAFLSSTFAKGLIQLLMILLFFVNVWFF